MISKRVFDIVVAGFGLILLLPFLLIIAVLIKICSRGSIFFRQKRVGKNGKIFKIIKFRTMKNKCDKDGNLLPDNKRITLLGAFMRKTSLDELPTLINVFIGNMSLVGPRPLLFEDLPHHSEHKMKRLEAVPGITGWAQINGRNGIAWEDKFEKDLWYMENKSMWLDLKIIFLTMPKVLKCTDINGKGGGRLNDHTLQDKAKEEDILQEVH
jgi:lipopolysaccharide/colanic/teichoic acid biosynthesis glycosyltransferase